ncbi:unnamed protein product [Closterium sp. Yama58-4]|nr:unnamed protein product [Closterium sp. Yama58-4]
MDSRPAARRSSEAKSGSDLEGADDTRDEERGWSPSDGSEGSSDGSRGAEEAQRGNNARRAAAEAVAEAEEDSDVREEEEELGDEAEAEEGEEGEEEGEEGDDDADGPPEEGFEPFQWPDSPPGPPPVVLPLPEMSPAPLERARVTTPSDDDEDDDDVADDDDDVDEDRRMGPRLPRRPARAAGSTRAVARGAAVAPEMTVADLEFPGSLLGTIMDGLGKWPWTVWPNHMRSCLAASARILHAVVADPDESGSIVSPAVREEAQRLMRRAVLKRKLATLFREAAPSLFDKCLDDRAIWKWGRDVHGNIFEAFLSLMDVIVLKLPELIIAREALADAAAAAAGEGAVGRGEGEGHGERVRERKEEVEEAERRSVEVEEEIAGLLTAMAQGWDSTCQFHCKHKNEQLPRVAPRLDRPCFYAISLPLDPAPIGPSLPGTQAAGGRSGAEGRGEGGEGGGVGSHQWLVWFLNYFGQTAYGNGYERVVQVLLRLMAGFERQCDAHAARLEALRREQEQKQELEREGRGNSAGRKAESPPPSPSPSLPRLPVPRMPLVVVEALLRPLATAAEFLTPLVGNMLLQPCRAVLVAITRCISSDQMDSLNEGPRDGSFQCLSLTLRHVRALLALPSSADSVRDIIHDVEMTNVEYEGLEDDEDEKEEEEEDDEEDDEFDYYNDVEVSAATVVRAVQRHMVKRMLGVPSFSKQLSAAREINRMLETAAALKANKQLSAAREINQPHAGELGSTGDDQAVAREISRMLESLAALEMRGSKHGAAHAGSAIVQQAVISRQGDQPHAGELGSTGDEVRLLVCWWVSGEASMVQRMLGVPWFSKQLSAVREINQPQAGKRSCAGDEMRGKGGSAMMAIINWLEAFKILPLVLRSNLHHKQYVDQVRPLVRTVHPLKQYLHQVRLCLLKQYVDQVRPLVRTVHPLKQYLHQVVKIMRALLNQRRLREKHLDAVWAATEKPDQFEAAWRLALLEAPPQPAPAAGEAPVGEAPGRRVGRR